jgi:hypothetical protein
LEASLAPKKEVFQIQLLRENLKKLLKRYVVNGLGAAGLGRLERAMNDDAGALKARGEAQGGAVDRAAAANYVAELSAELADLARHHGLNALGYILDMARLEAENATRYVNGRR